VVGREEELRLIRDWLVAEPPQTRCLALEGEPGIGKSTLFEYALDVARRDGWAILVARPTLIESELSFATLADLLHGLDLEREQLPPPRRRALDVALLESYGDRDSVDPGAVAAAVTAILEKLASTRALAIAIDDAQWVDTPSAFAINFARRRLRDLPVRWLMTRRTGDSERGLTIAAMPAAPQVTHSVEGLSLVELNRLFTLRLGEQLPRTLLSQVERVSDGNPLYALELARRVIAAGRSGELSGVDLVPPTASDLLRQHVDDLPAPVRRLAVVASLAAAPSVDLLARVERLKPSTVRRRVRMAADAGILRLADDQIAFSHPLLAQVAANYATGVELVRVHRRLADEVDSAEERVRHRSMATVEPSASVADELESAAVSAGRRGAATTAAELIALAIERTPPTARPCRDRRLLMAGEVALRVGDTRRAREILTELASGSDSVVQIAALLLLARIAWFSDSARDVKELGARAMALATTELEQARIGVALAGLSRNDREWGLRHATNAIRILDRLADDAPPDLRVRAVVAVLDTECDLGRPLRTDQLESALLLARQVEPGKVTDSARYYLATILLGRDDLARARPMFLECLAEANIRGDEGSVVSIHDQLAQLELLAGNWSSARHHAVLQVSTAELNDQLLERIWGLETLALIDVREGTEGARERADAVLAQSRNTGDPISIAFALRTAAEAAREAGELDRAVASLLEIDEIAKSVHWLSPNSIRHAAELVDLLVQIGRLDDAEARSRSLVVASQEGELLWGLAAGARAEAVVHAARGRLDAALDAATASVDRCRSLDMPFEVGRSLLVLAAVHRRRRAKAAAADALSEATEVFRLLGAQPWIARTSTERSRAGVRTAGHLDLTRTERMVAELAVQGMSNPEISARLFMSRKTVEFNLGKVYRKLQIRGRGQLATKLPPESGEFPGSSG
jgi:DNA-binding CsgD family transcriptional regulator